jgi:hypothetical protein
MSFLSRFRVIAVALTLVASLQAAPPKPSPQLPGLPKKEHRLTTSDLAHGRKQILKMVRDRPVMLQYVDENSPVYQWVLRGYAGALTGHRVDWNNDVSDLGNYNAQHESADVATHAYIQLSTVDAFSDPKGKKLSCEALWAGVVFELINITHDVDFDKLDLDAQAGKVDRKTYIERGTRGEFEALRDTYVVYQRVWLPWATHRKLAIDGAYWWSPQVETYEKWIAGYTDPKSYPWDSWGKDWDDFQKGRSKGSGTGKSLP